MKILPATFRSDGFDFQQLAREAMVVLLRKTKPQFSNESFEVVILHQSPAWINPQGNAVPAAECMPRNEKWGEQGWSYRDKEVAWAKFRCVVESKASTLRTAQA
jgi:hypothetical protein